MPTTANTRKQEFDRQGFLAVKGFLSATEAADLLRVLREAQEVAQQQSQLDRHGLTFKHNLWRHSQPLRDFLSSPKVVELLRDIIGPDIWLRWDQTVEKTPGGALFPWHQDNGYNGLSAQHYQFWIALTPMNRHNGGLWIQPGSHRHGVLRHHFSGTHVVCPGNEDDALFIDAEPGDAIVFSSLMLHKTDPNTTDTSRLAYVAEYMKTGEVDPWIDPPFFVVARDGKPAPALVDHQVGRLRPINLWRYSMPAVRRSLQALKRRLNGILRRSDTAAH